MTEKKHDKKAKAKKDEKDAVEKQSAKNKGELTDEQLDKAAGGQRLANPKFD